MNEVSDFSVMRKRRKGEIAEATANRKASRNIIRLERTGVHYLTLSVEESDRLKIESR